MLIAVVLLQPGKTDAGALFTSNISSSAFGPRGTATVLSKTTIITATIFMLSALMLSMPAITGNISVLNSNPEAPAATTNNAANANVDVNAGAPNSTGDGAVTVPPSTNLNSSTTNTTNANAPASNTNAAANANTRANTNARSNANANR